MNIVKESLSSTLLR